jgi:hypothetical protein
MAEGHTPTDAMAGNARRGLKLRSEYGRGGTAVGVARARDIANKKSLSDSTVMRMHSFFSRHRVDKKGKGWTPGSEGYPSNGLIAWLLWGGDSGARWAESKRNAIVNARKSMWSGTALSFQKAESVRVGQMVSWNSSGGRAEGKVVRVIRNGSYSVPGSSLTITGTPDDPAAAIRVYRNGEPTDTIVGHKVKTLSIKS